MRIEAVLVLIAVALAVLLIWRWEAPRAVVEAVAEPEAEPEAQKPKWQFVPPVFGIVRDHAS